MYGVIQFLAWCFSIINFGCGIFLLYQSMSMVKQLQSAISPATTPQIMNFITIFGGGLVFVSISIILAGVALSLAKLEE